MIETDKIFAPGHMLISIEAIPNYYGLKMRQ